MPIYQDFKHFTLVIQKMNSRLVQLKIQLILIIIIARKVILMLKDNFCIMLCPLFIDVYFNKFEDWLEFFLFVYYDI